MVDGDEERGSLLWFKSVRQLHHYSLSPGGVGDRIREVKVQNLMD